MANNDNDNRSVKPDSESERATNLHERDPIPADEIDIEPIVSKPESKGETTHRDEDWEVIAGLEDWKLVETADGKKIVPKLEPDSYNQGGQDGSNES